MLGRSGLTLPPAPCSPPATFRPQWAQPTTSYEALASPFAPSAPPVDIVVQVAGHRFHAHRSVLAAHSGYFKCILADYSASSSLQPSAPSSSQKLPELLFLTLSIPSMSPKLFAVLLDFMYSSRLRLEAHSVADLLFGAQLLRMQRAIDACHSHLLQLQRLFGYPSVGLYPVPLSPERFPQVLPPPPPHHTGIVRPIPTTGTPAYFTPYQTYPRHSFDVRFVPLSSATETRHQEYESANSHPLELHPRPANDNAEAGPFIAARALRCLSGIMPLNPAADQTTDQKERHSPAPSSGTRYSSGSAREQSSTASTPCPTFNPNEGAEETEGGGNDKDSNDLPPKEGTASVKAVIDIACCDGPVKFQRVLNENCSLVIMMTAATAQDESTRPLLWSGDPPEAKTKSSFSTCCQTTVEKTDSPSSPSREATVSPVEKKPSSSSGLLYHCVHCKHSFKSRCCYLKHRWRHLNPLTLDGQYGRRKQRAPHREPVLETSKPSAERETDAGRGDGWKPLEINVPFYPCKVCGCKFPSYYFVHKHRRACHQKRRRQRQEEGRGYASGSSEEDNSSDAISEGEDDNASTTDICNEGGEDSQEVE